ncbi:MAG: hypothetical protein H6816_02630 [Phycisphaerales bacterium]|nr:hypothetical protein [Phycisphaerales bacterium]
MRASWASVTFGRRPPEWSLAGDRNWVSSRSADAPRIEGAREPEPSTPWQGLHPRPASRLSPEAAVSRTAAVSRMAGSAVELVSAGPGATAGTGVDAAAEVTCGSACVAACSSDDFSARRWHPAAAMQTAIHIVRCQRRAAVDMV